jgi:hypothetical protein
MERQSAVEYLKDLYLLANGKLIMQDFEYAKKMETDNTRYACGLAISKLLYHQAIKESEKNNVSEEKNNIDQQEGIKIILRNLKGAIIKVDESWMIAHDFIDPYSQIPTQLPIHFNSYIATQLTENLKVDFDIFFQNNQYFALI